MNTAALHYRLEHIDNLRYLPYPGRSVFLVVSPPVCEQARRREGPGKAECGACVSVPSTTEGNFLNYLAVPEMFATFAVPNKITHQYESLTAA